MGDERRTHLTPRAGPVAGLPIESLLQRAEEIARRWAISLVVARPLPGLGEVPLEELAREAPALCAQALRALESDEELDRLTGSRSDGRQDSAPARRLGPISGADDAAATVEAAEALRGALWEALLEELRWPSFEQLSPRRVADVSDRLAFVCASALAAALAPDAPASQAAARDAGAAGADTEADAVPVQREPSAARRAVIVDEREDASGAPRRRPAEIEIRDERNDAGPAAWIGSIGRQLERFTRDGRPFAVLLVELRDSDRMGGDSRLEEVSRLADQLEHALTSELRRSAARAGADGLDPRVEPAFGSLTRERPGRYWLLAPDTGRTGAKAIAERLADALRRLASDRGASLEVAVGTAACPEDGREAAALAAHADVELYAARSAAGTPAGRPAASVD
jgi:GGDEF domain-containing protein